MNKSGHGNTDRVSDKDLRLITKCFLKNCRNQQTGKREGGAGDRNGSERGRLVVGGLSRVRED